MLSHAILFSYETMTFYSDWKRFKQNFIVGRYLGKALNGLSFL